MAEEKQTQQPEAPATPPNAQVRDKRVLPEGVVPKQAQGYVVAGLAVLILMAVLFSKNHARTVPKETATTPTAAASDVNQQRIRDLEQDLSADQRQSQQQQAQAQKETPLVRSLAMLLPRKRTVLLLLRSRSHQRSRPATRLPTRKRRWPSKRASHPTSSVSSKLRLLHQQPPYQRLPIQSHSRLLLRNPLPPTAASAHPK